MITGGIGPAAIRTLVLEMRATVWLVASHPTNGYRVHVDIRETRHLSSTTCSVFGTCPGQIRRNSNNNQVWLNISGCPPLSRIINYSGSSSALEITYTPTTAKPVAQDPPWYVCVIRE